MPTSSRGSSRAPSAEPAVALRPLRRADGGEAERTDGGAAAPADEDAAARGDADATARGDRVAAARADRDAIERIVRATGAFREDEIAVALELVDADVSEGYRFVVAEVDGEVAGFACYGATPMTIGTWDLYWIAVDPGMQGKGIGRRMLGAAEDAVRSEQGRMLLIETGGKASYGATRNAYLAWGYGEIARVPDFYEIGDDKVIYGRSL